MYIVAQRVVSPTGLTGVNAFLYLHGDRRWTEPPAEIPGTDPGRLAQKKIEVEPNANVVRSNFDVVAPDDIDVRELRRLFLRFAEGEQFHPFPWKGVEGPCRFHLDMVPALIRAGWAREARTLAGVGHTLVATARGYGPLPPRR